MLTLTKEMLMPVTLKAVAEKAGVSLMTVSNILNKGKRDLYKKKTREKVEKIASELGYRPVHAARSLRNGRTGTITFLLSEDIGNSFLIPRRIDGLLEACRKHTLELLLHKLPEDRVTDPEYVPAVLQKLMCDGMIIGYQFMVPEHMTRLIDSYPLPAVWMFSKLDHDSVYVDNIASMKNAMKFLRELGHTRIAYADYGGNVFGEKHGHYSRFDRYLGYEESRKQGNEKVVLYHCEQPVRPKDRISEILKWLKPEERPTAVITYDADTFNCILHAAAIAGVRIPEDLSLMSFGKPTETDWGLHITHVSWDFYTYSEAAVQMLLEKIKNPEIRIESKEFICDVIEGETTAALPR